MGGHGALRMGAFGADVGDAQAAGVAADGDLHGQDGVQAGKQILLGLHIFHNGLDDQAGLVRRGNAVGAGLQQADGTLGFLMGIQTVFLPQADAVDGFPATVLGALGTGVHQHGAVAGQGAHGADAAAHHAAAHYHNKISHS